MEIEISEDISENIDKASRELGVNKKEFITRALRFYLYNLMKERDLKKEIDAWEKASIEDFESFGKLL